MLPTTLKNTKSDSIIQNPLIVTYAYYAMFIVLGMVTASIGPSLPFLANNTGTALGNIGILFSARAGGYLGGSLVSGGVYDRRPGHRILAGMMAVLAISFFALPVVMVLWVLILIAFLLGFSEAAVDVGGNTLLVWIHHKNVGPFMNALHAFFGVGSFLSPLILAQTISSSHNIILGYRVMALMIIPIIIWIWRLPSPSAPLTTKHMSDERMPDQTSTPWLVLIISVFLFLYVGVEVGFSGWIFTYALTLGLATETSAALLTSAFWGTFTLARIFSIPLATRVRPKTAILIGLTGGLTCIALIIVKPSSVLALWLGTLGLGASIAAIFPSAISFAENRVQLTGQRTRWFFAGGGLGGMILPWLLGKFFGHFGALMVIRLLIVDAILAMILFIAILLQEKSLFGNCREKCHGDSQRPRKVSNRAIAERSRKKSIKADA